jgi:hypothetical protein
MGNWVFLILLYFFFGWMKKRQQTKAREKIESQEDWDTGNFAKFGEKILENFLEEEREDEEEIIEGQKAYEKEEDALNAEIIEQDEKGDISSPSILTEQYTENLEKEVSIRSDYKINRKNINALDSIVDINNPLKTAIIFKEILDKPRALRKKIR